MRAAFTVAAWYEVRGECRTPLRTGGTDNLPETVLRDTAGGLLLQGSSLAGAMREWLEAGGMDASGLFGASAAGGQIRPGRLILSDGEFYPDANTDIRPRLKLDPRTRAAEDNKKFDMAHIQAGARFSFRLFWLGTQERQEEELKSVERLLSALHSGEIRLGAQKSNGFGRVCLQYRRRVYVLTDAADRRDWLDRKAPDGEFLTPETLADRREARFVLRFHADSLLVKSGAVRSTKDDGAIAVPIEENGCPVIPGSSVKGAVRARAEQIAALKELSPDVTRFLFGRPAAGGGDTGAAGAVRFEDIRLPDGKRTRVSRIRINRFTGGVIRSGLFREETASTRSGPEAASVPAELRVSLPANRENWRKGCALLLYALRDLAWNLYGLGSGRSIGRGSLCAEELEIQLPDGGKALFRFREGFRCEASGEVETVKSWLEELEAEPV